jgi:hypothetical protein
MVRRDGGEVINLAFHRGFELCRPRALLLLSLLTSLGCASASRDIDAAEGRSTPRPSQNSSTTQDVDTFVAEMDVIDASTRTRSQDTLQAPDRSLDVVMPKDTQAESSSGDSFTEGDISLCPDQAPCTIEELEPCYEGRCNADGLCEPTPIPACCIMDDECSELAFSHPCEYFKCVEHHCVSAMEPACCTDDMECQDSHECTIDSCKSPGDLCLHCAVDCTCPTPAVKTQFSFNAPYLLAEGFKVVDEQTQDAISWRTSIRRWAEPPSSAYLGHATCHTYYSGLLSEDCQPISVMGVDANRVRAALLSPPLEIPDSPGGYAALFWIWADVEPLQSGGDSEPDVVTVSVIDPSGKPWSKVKTTEIGKSTGGQWVLMGFDLSPWAGTSPQVEFLFDTLDGQDNHHEGVYLDELEIVSRCHGGCCSTDADCFGLAPDSPCDEPRCIFLNDDSGGVCATIYSQPGNVCEACDEDIHCVDEDPCTEDTCNLNGLCTHESFCCVDSLPLNEGFEIGLGEFFVQDGQLSDGVHWKMNPFDHFDGSLSAWIASASTHTYETNAPVSTSMISAAFVLPEFSESDAELLLTFWLKLSTEWDGQVYDNPAGIDRFTVEVIAASLVHEVWSSDDVQGSTQGLWVPIQVDLSTWSEQSIHLKFMFDSIDEVNNDFTGPVIDEVIVGRFCGGNTE